MAKPDPIERALYDEVRIYVCTDSCPDTWRVGFKSGVPASEHDTACPNCGEPGYDAEAADALSRF